MFLERFQFVKSMLPDDEGCHLHSAPEVWVCFGQLKSLLFEGLHENIGYKVGMVLFQQCNATSVAMVTRGCAGY